jgi:hypothetical protein
VVRNRKCLRSQRDLVAVEQQAAAAQIQNIAVKTQSPRVRHVDAAASLIHYGASASHENPHLSARIIRPVYAFGPLGGLKRPGCHGRTLAYDERSSCADDRTRGNPPDYDRLDAEWEMSEGFQAFLDSGGLYLAVAAILCIVIGVGATRRLFRGAKKAE